MPTRRIFIPEVNLSSGFQGVDALLAAIQTAWENPERIVFDFSRCGFISAEGVAALVAQKLRRDTDGYQTTIDWSTVTDKVTKQFGKWQIASLFDSKNPAWTDNSIPLFHQPTREYTQLIEFTERFLVSGANMPRMTPALAKKTKQNICELFLNVFRHSKSPIGGIAIGQLYPHKREVQICICDAGVGMVQQVQSYLHARGSPVDAVDAIKWALERGHSTWRGREPPGVGLYTLREFIKENGGVFRIYANGGYYSEYAGSSSGRYLQSTLPGTLIDLRLNVRDDVTYTLTSSEKVANYENFDSGSVWNDLR